MAQEEIEYNLSNVKRSQWLKGMAIIIVVVIVTALLLLKIFNNSNYVVINDAKLVGTKIEVKSKVNGLLGDILIANGAFVNVGQVIAKIDTTDLAKKKAELDSKLSEAKLNYAKLKANTNVPQQINTYTKNNNSVSTVNNAEIEKAKATKEKMEKLFSMGAISKIQYNKAVEDYNNLVSENSSNVSNDSVSQNQDSNYSSTVKDTLLDTASIQIRQLESAIEALNFTRNFRIFLLLPVVNLIY